MSAHLADPSRTRTLEGVLWMLGSGLSFVGVTGIVRYLGTDIPAAQGAFLRFAFGVLFLLPTLLPVLRQGFAPGTLKLYSLRGAFHTAAVICWFYAMARIPVAEVTAIGYLNPVLVTVGAALFFSERLALRRILAVAVALVGALIVLRPGLRELSSGHLSQLCAACLFAGSYLLARRLSDVAGAGAIVAMMSLMVTIGLLPFALLVWVPLGAIQLMWLALVAVFATLGHYCMTRAFGAAPLAVTQPVTFLQLVWATLLGALAFGERVDPFVLLGGGVIIGAISYITWRESVLRRRARVVALENT
ncbi:DMT family transporter [Rhodobacter sp. NSM]|uniref:DMT family transporter n=1 Tax=Rhodobacter sp. NSM TaxID=3457501 RepID=UPI003FD500F8